MSDATEATGALRLAAQLIDQAIEENDPTERLGKLLALKEVPSPWAERAVMSDLRWGRLRTIARDDTA